MTEDERLEQRVRRQPVGAVQAGHRDLAGGVEAADVGGAVGVGDRAAAAVVRRRHDRDRLLGDVDAEAAGSARRWSGSVHAGSPRRDGVMSRYTCS